MMERDDTHDEMECNEEHNGERDGERYWKTYAWPGSFSSCLVPETKLCNLIYQLPFVVQCRYRNFCAASNIYSMRRFFEGFLPYKNYVPSKLFKLKDRKKLEEKIPLLTILQRTTTLTMGCT